MAKDTFFYPKATMNCRGRLLDLSFPKIMGILNITPDSFYDGNLSKSQIDLLRRSEKMILDGADIIDIGGYSSRPGAKDISIKEEINRVIPAIKTIVKEFPDIIISIDSFRSNVVKRALDVGATMVNDISGGEIDPKMPLLVSKERVPYIIMHMQGTPQTMQKNPVYQNITEEIIQYFAKKIKQFEKLGINDLIIDPGFGFGKTLENNYQLLNELNDFKILNSPILVGLSRKSMIYKPLSLNPSTALNGTTVLNTIAISNGANILRVHDPKYAKETLSLLRLLKRD